VHNSKMYMSNELVEKIEELRETRVVKVDIQME
jgi:hypothetical protein